MAKAVTGVTENCGAGGAVNSDAKIVIIPKPLGDILFKEIDNVRHIERLRFCAYERFMAIDMGVIEDDADDANDTFIELSENFEKAALRLDYVVNGLWDLTTKALQKRIDILTLVIKTFRSKTGKALREAISPIPLLEKNFIGSRCLTSVDEVSAEPIIRIVIPFEIVVLMGHYGIVQKYRKLQLLYAFGDRIVIIVAGSNGIASLDIINGVIKRCVLNKCV